MSDGRRAAKGRTLLLAASGVGGKGRWQAEGVNGEAHGPRRGGGLEE